MVLTIRQANSDDGTWTAATTTNTTENQVGYVRNRDPSSGTAVQYPERQELHVFAEMKCGDNILAGGNDTDTGGTDVYQAGDIVASTSRALAFVYQIEGEDNAPLRRQHLTGRLFSGKATLTGWLFFWFGQTWIQPKLSNPMVITLNPFNFLCDHI